MGVLADALSLPAFLRRQSVLGLYRALLRASAADDRIRVRSAFEAHRHTHDPVALRALIGDASKTLAAVRGASSTEGRQGGASGWMEGSVEGDVRGRVGQGWPWER